jgi:hypothetical protein
MSSGHKITQKALMEWANAKYRTSVSTMSIGRLLKKKESVPKEDVGQLGEMKRLRKVHCPTVELATFKWVTEMIERGATLSDDLIIVAAKRFYDLTPRESSEKELHFSAG